MTSKERMIHILLLLKRKTWDDQPLTTAEIVRHFTDMGVPTDRNTVKKDIETMISCGIDIVVDKGAQTRYSYVDYAFELPELKLLIDAVEASRFITAEKSGELVKKLSSMTSPGNAEELKRQLYTTGRIKSENKSIYYVVDALHQAVNLGRQIRFQYYEYNVLRERVPHQGSKKYIFSPYAMIYNEDKYYVLGYSESHGKIVTFRIDRMGVPEVLERPVRPRPPEFDPVDYTVNVFSMYDGKASTVRLLCANHLMNHVVDRFGDDFKSEVVDAGHFAAEVEVSVSQTFYAWVFQFTGEMQILGPKSVQDVYKWMLEQANS